MPLYVFQCPKCGQEVEELRDIRFSGKPMKSCNCQLGGTLMERRVTAPSSFKLKGPGFHGVDYPKAN